MKKFESFYAPDNCFEFNYGLRLERLAKDPEEWNRLRTFLRNGHKDMEICVEDGSAPLFGYPPICYSPPASSVTALKR